MIKGIAESFNNSGEATGCFTKLTGYNTFPTPDGSYNWNDGGAVSYRASISSPGYGRAPTLYPGNYRCNWWMKVK